MTRILVIEDNEDVAFGLRTVFEFEGYRVTAAVDGRSGIEAAREQAPDVVILDLMLPDRSGYDVLRELRHGGTTVPVLVLTARSQETDVLLGFETGADDYVTKPFSTPELLARVRALLRRAHVERAADMEPHRFVFGDATVDTKKRTVVQGGREVALTPKEFGLLVALLRRGGAVASRRELLGEVWEYGNTDVATRTVDVHIAELRRKLEADPSESKHILTVRKAGYRVRR